MLRDAVLRITGAADTIGVRAILVHAISLAAKAFYERHGFTVYGVEPGALRIGDRAYDDELRIRFL